MSDKPENKKIVIASGGSGGHMYPAETLALELRRRGWDVTLFTDRRGLNNYRGPLTDFPTAVIAAAGVTGKSLTQFFQSAWLLARGTVTAWRRLRRIGPAAVVGFGGYASAPTVAAAWVMRIPIIVHEQNAVLGRVNRLVAPMVKRIALSFPNTALVPAKAGTVFTGMPVRADVVAVKKRPADESPFHLLVIGGSQGAKIFGETVPEAVASLPRDMRESLKVWQQCRPDDVQRVYQLYEEKNIANEVSAFFTNVPELLGRASLVIARGGSSTITEILTVGLPSVIVPLPTSADDQQTLNAKLISDHAAGWVFRQEDFTTKALAALMDDLLSHREKLAKAGDNARALGAHEAAAKLADAVIEVAHGV